MGPLLEQLPEPPGKKGKKVKRHRTPKLTDAEISRRWSQYAQEERQRYARTVDWLRCCATLTNRTARYDIYAAPCPGSKADAPHRLTVMDDRKGNLKTACAFCLCAGFLQHSIDKLTQEGEA